MNIATRSSHYDMATAQAMVAATLMASVKESCSDSFKQYEATGGREFGSDYELLIEWSTFAAEDLIRASSKSILWVKEDLEAQAE